VGVERRARSLTGQQPALPTDTASQVAPTSDRSAPYLTFGHELSASLPTTAPSLRAREAWGDDHARYVAIQSNAPIICLE